MGKAQTEQQKGECSRMGVSSTSVPLWTDTEPCGELHFHVWGSRQDLRVLSSMYSMAWVPRACMHGWLHVAYVQEAFSFLSWICKKVSRSSQSNRKWSWYGLSVWTSFRRIQCDVTSVIICLAFNLPWGPVVDCLLSDYKTLFDYEGCVLFQEVLSMCNDCSPILFES